MAASALVGRAVVKSAAAGQSTVRPVTAPTESGGAPSSGSTPPSPYPIARRAFSRLGHFSRET